MSPETPLPDLAFHSDHLASTSHGWPDGCSYERHAYRADEWPAKPERPAATLFFTADDIDAALATIRGEVTYHESIVMAAAGAAAAAMRTGRPIVSADKKGAGHL